MMKIALFFDGLLHYFGRTWWASTVLNDTGSFLKRGENVLDIGAGVGWPGELLSKERGVKVQLLDVEDLNRSNLPLLVYDGKKIPFKDDSFDNSLLLFVLHHCEDPTAVLKEALRVTKKRIIIHEDTYNSSFEFKLATVNDFIANLPFFITNPFKMHMPYNFRKVKEWEQVFQELGLQVRFKNITKHFITKHVLFVLDK